MKHPSISSNIKRPPPTLTALDAYLALHDEPDGEGDRRVVGQVDFGELSLSFLHCCYRCQCCHRRRLWSDYGRRYRWLMLKSQFFSCYFSFWLFCCCCCCADTLGGGEEKNARAQNLINLKFRKCFSFSCSRCVTSPGCCLFLHEEKRPNFPASTRSRVSTLFLFRCSLCRTPSSWRTRTFFFLPSKTSTFKPLNGCECVLGLYFLLLKLLM